MSADILAIDVGTSALKIGVFGPDLERRCEARRTYAPHLYDRGKADIEPAVWWEALRDCCAEVATSLSGVGVVSLSVTTPGLTPMTADGTPLAPAVLFLELAVQPPEAFERGRRRTLGHLDRRPVIRAGERARVA